MRNKNEREDFYLTDESWDIVEFPAIRIRKLKGYPIIRIETIRKRSLSKYFDEDWIKLNTYLLDGDRLDSVIPITLNKAVDIMTKIDRKEKEEDEEEDYYWTPTYSILKKKKKEDKNEKAN